MRTFSIEYQNGIVPITAAEEAQPYIDAMLDSAFEYVTVHASEPIGGVSFVQTYRFTDESNRVTIGTESGIGECFCPPAEAVVILRAFLAEAEPDSALFSLCE